MASDEPKLLVVDDLRTDFVTADRIVHAVKGVTFDVTDGEVVGLVGETGSGKSALMRSVIGLTTPPGRVVAGRVLFRGEDLRAASRQRMRQLRGREIALVPQNPWGALNPIVRIGKQFRNIIKDHNGRGAAKESRALAAAMLGGVGIADPDRVLDGYAHQLSGGMAQRVVIAMALLLNPRLIVADEPTTGLDTTVQRQVLDTIGRLVEERGATMIIVTHDLGVAARYCGRVMVMHDGEIVESGPVDRVFDTPTHWYTSRLMEATRRLDQPLRYPEGEDRRARQISR